MKRSISAVCVVCICLMVFACGASDIQVVRAVDRENMSMILLAGENAALQEIYDADFVIVGGSLSGLTAAFAACAAGRQTVLIEETGQITACFADTNSYIGNRFAETSGTSERVKVFKNHIRDWYRTRNRPQPRINLPPVYAGLDDFNSGGFCFETDAALAAVDSLLARYINRGRLTVLTRHKVTEVITFGQRIQSLNVVDLDKHLVHQVRGWVFIDATETGELLPLAGADFALGGQEATEDSAAMYDTYYYPDELAGAKNGEVVVSLSKARPAGDSAFGSVSFARVPRRLRGYHTIGREEIAASSQHGPRASFFRDSVGIGYSPVLSDTTDAVQTRPFQIPLRAMVPREVANLVVAGPSIDADLSVASAYRTPSVRMAIGESAGVIAEYSAARSVSPRDIIDDSSELLELQEFLVRRRHVPIYWFDNVTPEDSTFVDAQLAPFRDPAFDSAQRTLSYEPVK